MKVRVGAVVVETPEILRIELRPVDGQALLPFTAGAHIDVHMANGLARSYSLLNDAAERHRYVIGVGLERESRGGSRWIHDHLKVGDELLITDPRNNFPLVESARRSVLIGGGIGVTPMLSMASRLQSMGKDWRLYYCSRSRAAAAFLDDLAPLAQNVRLRFDDEETEFLDFAALIAAAPDAHFYCCGPKSMMSACVAAAKGAGVEPERVHIEYFQPPEELVPQGGFEVELARSRRVIPIPLGKTILQVLQAQGVAATSSCEAGVCGECQTAVLAGIPDHKDLVLSDAERASNKMMMICCSGSLSERLVLDL